MVNFIGFHNADVAEFFFFEIVSSTPPSITIQRGDLLFGHFTGPTTTSSSPSKVADLLLS
jgi:hypothetical protein